MSEISLEAELLLSILVAVFGVALGDSPGLLTAGLATVYGLVVTLHAAVGDD